MKEKSEAAAVLCDYDSFHYNLYSCLLYTSDAADERSSVDLGGRRIIKKKNNAHSCRRGTMYTIH